MGGDWLRRRTSEAGAIVSDVGGSSKSRTLLGCGEAADEGIGSSEGLLSCWKADRNLLHMARARLGRDAWGWTRLCLSEFNQTSFPQNEVTCIFLG